MEKKTIKRSRGVTAFGIIVIIFGGLGTLGIFFGWIILTKQGPSVMQAFERYGLTLKQMIIFHTIGTVLVILLLVSGIGILKLKEWARRLILGIAVAIITARVIQTAIGLIRAKYITLLETIFALIFYGLIIWFFNRPSVKTQFKP